MNRIEFLDILRQQLNGKMHDGKIAAHIRYYEDYIQSQVRNGRTEKEVLEELGDPRLIARTLLATDNGQSVAEEYSTYAGSNRETEATGGKKVHVWRLDTWYSKLIGILIVLILVLFVFHILVVVIPFFVVLAVILFVISLLKNKR